MKKCFALLLTVLLVAAQGAAVCGASYSTYTDVSGHWAGTYLQYAVEQGILSGNEGKLTPNGTLTGGQLATIVVRDCNLQIWTDAYPGTDTGDWYYRAAAEAYTAGVLPSDGSLSMGNAVSREQVFQVLARAYYGLKEKQAEPESPEIRETPEPESTSTEENVSESEKKETTVVDNAALGSSAGDVYVQSEKTDAENVDKTDDKKTETTADAAAAQADEEKENAAGENAAETETEITADEAASLDTTDVSQPVVMDPLAKYPDAGSLSEEGREAAILLVNAGILQGSDKGTLNPSKSITRAEFAALFYRLKQSGAQKTISYDAALSPYSEMKIMLSASEVTAGKSIAVSAAFQNVPTGMLYDMAWLLDGSTVSGYTASAKSLSGDSTSSFSKKLTYTKNMRTSYNVGLEIKPLTNGKSMRIYKDVVVNVQNYPDSYYSSVLNTQVVDGTPVSQIFDSVRSSFNGTRSTSYNPDYTTATKEAFVNGKGYSSKTQYLIWTNLATQKVNIFEGSQYNWRLIQCFRCGSGASSTPTPQGVTYITYKQSGWYEKDYVCKPVVRFYPGTGYAFHSILYTADQKGIKDGRVGFPVSHGCVRMTPTGISWIYNNVPVNTTVVIY